jgi:hypothetical protein
VPAFRTRNEPTDDRFGSDGFTVDSCTARLADVDWNQFGIRDFIHGEGPWSFPFYWTWDADVLVTRIFLHRFRLFGTIFLRVGLIDRIEFLRKEVCMLVEELVQHTDADTSRKADLLIEFGINV